MYMNNANDDVDRRASAGKGTSFRAYSDTCAIQNQLNNFVVVLFT